MPTLSFGFIVCHIEADFQRACAGPVLPDQERSQRHIARPNKVCVEGRVAFGMLADKEQALVGPVVRAGQPSAAAGGLRMRAFRGLRPLEEVGPAPTKALQDADPGVRRLAAEALEYMPDSAPPEAPSR